MKHPAQSERSQGGKEKPIKNKKRRGGKRVASMLKVAQPLQASKYSVCGLTSPEIFVHLWNIWDITFGKTSSRCLPGNTNQKAEMCDSFCVQFDIESVFLKHPVVSEKKQRTFLWQLSITRKQAE